MKPQQLSSQKVSASLLVSTPSQTTMDIAATTQPFPGLFMNLPVSEVDFFDKNPRKQHDPEIYQQIKESIRASGVQQPVHVTQRPNSKRYILAQGGNTRLQIMKELFTETADNRFSVIPCIFIEYSSETNIQIAHLIENEQRQEMCFWDKACAYSEIRDSLQEKSDKKLSLRDLENLFLAHGLSLTHKTLGCLFFAKDYLSALGALCQELSNPKTIDLRKFYRELKEQCPNQNQFDQWWSEGLAQVSQDCALDVPEIESRMRQYCVNHQYIVEDDAVTAQNDVAEADSSLSAIGDTQGDSSDSGEVNPPHYQEDATQESNMLPETVLPQIETIERTVAIAPTSKEEGFKQLHQAVQQLLSLVKLSECFKCNSLFKYGFYIEYPNFELIESEPKHNEEAYIIIDQRHSEAGNVFAFLAKISGQEDLLYNPMLEDQNPILKLPEHSRLRIAYADPEVFDEYTQIGIGDRPYLADTLIGWLTTSSPLFSAVNEILTTLSLVNNYKE